MTHDDEVLMQRDVLALAKAVADQAACIEEQGKRIVAAEKRNLALEFDVCALRVRLDDEKERVHGLVGWSHNIDARVGVLQAALSAKVEGP